MDKKKVRAHSIVIVYDIRRLQNIMVYRYICSNEKLKHDDISSYETIIPRIL